MKIVKISNETDQNAQLGKRASAMIEWYNYCFKQNIPITEEGYNSIGRSNGIIKSISGDPKAFYEFCNKQNNFSPYSLIRDQFLSISNS
jgi:hypothetical protein